MLLSRLAAPLIFLQYVSALSPDASAGRLASCDGYSVTEVTETDNGIEAHLDLIGKGCSIYGPDVPKLKLLVEHETDSRLHILIQDRPGKRYQVPEDVLPRPSTDPSASSATSNLSFTYTTNPFTFIVTRRSTGEVLFDTTSSPLIFERQFLWLRTRLPKNPNIYGLGEHTDSFRLPNERYTRTLWARDSGGVPHGSNLYGSHPVYFEHRSTGTHGVFLASSNGMDIRLDREDKDHTLEYLIIGGVLDLYFMAGPSPIDVARQYAEIVGTPAMVPYWSLGFHQCKYGYRDWFEVAEVSYNYSLAGIPMETVWTDIDYMDHRRIFSLDEGNFPVDKMQQLVKYLHGRDQHYIVMIDPAVAEHDYRPYRKGIEDDVFVKDHNGKPFRGVVWPGVTVFPDWYSPNATDYWIDRFEEFFSPQTGVDVDGIWIDMNEPASFCRFPCDNPDKQAKDRRLPPRPPPIRYPPRKIPRFPKGETLEVIEGLLDQEIGEQEALHALNVRDPSKQTDLIKIEADHKGDNLLKPPYRINNHVPSGELSDLTMYTNLQHANGLWTYDTHNLYGALMGMATRAALLNRRPGLKPFIITRSTFAGSGRYVGKWLGDNISKWDHYRSSIAGMLGFGSIFQIPMVGSDACGFLGSASEIMCARWTTLAAFSPFFRNHADDVSPHQEFYLWPLVTSAAKYAIDIRYRMLDYLYTALSRQSKDGTPAVSPLWFAYPDDEETWGIDMQYLYGDCVLVSPVTQDGSKDVSIYLPDDIWYEWDTGEKIRGQGTWVTLTDVPYDRIPLHIRGGCILPLRAESANTTTALRTKGFNLLVAPGADGRAKGELYLDDGVSLDGGPDKTHVKFSFDGEDVTRDMRIGSEQSLHIESVTVLGKVEREDPREEL